jgi:hypothetical protein
MTDFIEEMQTEAKLRFGKELSPAEVATEFAKHGFEARIHHLKQLDTGDAYVDARSASKRFVYEHLLRETHKKLTALSR